MADSNGFSPLSEAPAAVRLAAAWAIGMDVTHPGARYRELPEIPEDRHNPEWKHIRWQVVGHDGGHAYLDPTQVAAAAERLARPDRVAIEDEETVPTTVAAIEPGDWIRARPDWAAMCMGQVIARATHPTLGPGFTLRNLHGALDFVAEDDTVILGYMDCRPPSETGEGEA